MMKNKKIKKILYKKNQWKINSPKKQILKKNSQKEKISPIKKFLYQFSDQKIS